MTAHEAKLTFDKQQYVCHGNWTILETGNLWEKFNALKLPKSKTIVLNGEELEHLDSAGALVLLQCEDKLKKKGNTVKLEKFSKQHMDLIELIDEKRNKTPFKKPEPKKFGMLYNIGKESIQKLKQVDGLLVLIGDLCEKIYFAFQNLQKFQLPSIFAHIYYTGITALPIIGLLSFLIGVVLAYQMGLQLETYGANSFISYLSGMAIFREFAPLITAIIVAGRTSSSFTAQIGIMKINEEIDALNTMGLSATELLVVPRVLALVIIFPLLIFWAVFFGICGAMFMSKLMLNVGYSDFLANLQESVGLKQLMLGLYKAPTFALLIALVGCSQGFRVEANADSLGVHTTKSVVQALFLIIIADATYSIIYSWLDL